MDGLDTYIDDYGKPDPIPMPMLRQMNQSQVPAPVRRRGRRQNKPYGRSRHLPMV